MAHFGVLHIYERRRAPKRRGVPDNLSPNPSVSRRACKHLVLLKTLSLMMMMTKDKLTLAWRQVLRLQGHVTISLNSEVT